MVTQNLESSPQQATDLASLWIRAVQEYERSANVDLSQLSVRSAETAAQSLSNVMEAAEREAHTFSKFHRKSDKMSKAKHSIGKHLDGMQKCLDGISIVGGAAAVFPPAMPVTLIFAACDRVLGAFVSVRDEMDKVEEFLGLSDRFFERLSIIEGSQCSDGPLGKAIVRVFSAQLSVYALIEDMVKRKGARVKMFFEALWEPQNPKLFGAYALMESSVEELDKTINFANHAAIKSTQNITIHVDERTSQMQVMLNTWREQQSEDILKIYESSLEIQTQLLRHETLVEGGFQDISRKLDAMMKANAQNKKATETRTGTEEKEKRKPDTRPDRMQDLGDNKAQAVWPLKHFLDYESENFRGWSAAQRENAAIHREYQSEFVKGTGEWLFSDPAWEQWINGDNPLLWMRGADGIGKSFLSYAGVRKMLEQNERSAIAYFHFREDTACLQSVQNAIACTALQAAEMDMKYAKYMGTKLADKENDQTKTTPWQQFFLSAYENNPSDRVDGLQDHELFLFFDGIDELPAEQLEVFRLFLTDLESSTSRIRVWISSRPGQRFIENAKPLIIDVSKDRITHDVAIFTRHRLNSDAFPRLKKFSRGSKRTIQRKIARKADGMLYADHMLRRWSYIGREGAVLRDLDNMPSNLPGLYKIMLDECCRGRSLQQYEALKKLFAWLAFSKRSLSLAEASELAALAVTDDDFDLEDEIIGRSARILELSSLSRMEDDNHEEDQEDDAEEHGETAANVEDYRYAPLTFQERSLRQYFRALSAENHGREELRTPAQTAHTTILTMCVEILRKSTEISKGGRGPELRSYAAKYWYEHFAELDIDVATNGEIVEIVECLHSVLTEQVRISRVFDHVAEQSELYPERREGDAVPWYDQVLPWVQKAMEIPDAPISAPVKVWAAELTSSGQHALCRISKAHVKNWLSFRSQASITRAYRNAQATTRICGRVEDLDADPLTKIMNVANYFDGDIAGRAKRAIGITLFFEGLDDCTETQRDELRSTALDYLRTDLELTKGDDCGECESGDTLIALSDMYDVMDKIPEALDALEKAITAFETYNLSLKTDPPRPFREIYFWNDQPTIDVESFYCNKAMLLKRLDRTDEAFQAYEKARAQIWQEDGDYLWGYYLNEITSIFNEDRDPDGQQLMSALKTWKEQEIRRWFTYNILPFTDFPALRTIFRASKLTGETELVLGWMDRYRKTLEPRSFAAFSLQYALVDFYMVVIRDFKKAKDTMRLVLTTRIDAVYRGTFDDVITNTRLRLAETVFSQFASASNPVRKEELMHELKSIPGLQEGDFNLAESHVGMLYAHMLRVMGPSREYEKQMNDLFETCVNRLSDEDSFNDFTTLRLLAKVLSPLKGLEFDSAVALSAQFSVLDNDLFNRQVERPKTPSESGDSDDSEADENASTTQATTENADPRTTNDGSTDNTADTTSNTVPHDSLDVSVNADTGVSTGVSSDVAKEPSPEGEKHPEEEDDQEILFLGGVWCDGGCGATMNKWDQPFYLCLICSNIDLCANCHKKKREVTSEEDEKLWRRFCSPHHRFVKGPLKGWNGIKGGVIRIDGSESVTVKTWLKEMKEDRWPKAWERYWYEQGKLHDIDVEE